MPQYTVAELLSLRDGTRLGNAVFLFNAVKYRLISIRDVPAENIASSQSRHETKILPNHDSPEESDGSSFGEIDAVESSPVEKKIYSPPPPIPADLLDIMQREAAALSTIAFPSRKNDNWNSLASASAEICQCQHVSFAKQNMPRNTASSDTFNSNPRRIDTSDRDMLEALSSSFVIVDDDSVGSGIQDGQVLEKNAISIQFNTDSEED